jgi:hypothetical protein
MLSGVEPRDITFNVTAASVRVETEISISSPSEIAASSALSDLAAYDSAALSQARCHPKPDPDPNPDPHP